MQRPAPRRALCYCYCSTDLQGLAGRPNPNCDASGAIRIALSENATDPVAASGVPHLTAVKHTAAADLTQDPLRDASRVPAVF